MKHTVRTTFLAVGILASGCAFIPCAAQVDPCSGGKLYDRASRYDKDGLSAAKADFNAHFKLANGTQAINMTSDTLEIDLLQHEMVEVGQTRGYLKNI